MGFFLSFFFSINFFSYTMPKESRDTVVSRDYTINLHKRLFGKTFKTRAPRAVREVKAFAEKAMGTNDVRLDTKVNRFLWSQGIRNPPRRIRVRLSRKRNEDEDAESKMYTLVQHLDVVSYK